MTWFLGDSFDLLAEWPETAKMIIAVYYASSCTLFMSGKNVRACARMHAWAKYACCQVYYHDYDRQLWHDA